MSVWSGKRKVLDRLIWTTWTTSGPIEAEEARAEARAETRARAEARARVTMGGLTHVHTHPPTLRLCG